MPGPGSVIYPRAHSQSMNKIISTWQTTQNTNHCPLLSILSLSFSFSISHSFPSFLSLYLSLSKKNHLSPESYQASQQASWVPPSLPVPPPQSILRTNPELALQRSQLRLCFEQRPLECPVSGCCPSLPPWHSHLLLPTPPHTLPTPLARPLMSPSLWTCPPALEIEGELSSG